MENNIATARVSKRIIAFIIDLIIISIITTPIFLVVIFNDSIKNFITYFNWFMLSGFLLSLLKDVYKGQSLGKRFTKIAVIDLKNNNSVPKISKLIIRNVFTYLWPIEILVLSAKKRKLGDLLTNTDVIEM